MADIHNSNLRQPMEMVLPFRNNYRMSDVIEMSNAYNLRIQFALQSGLSIISSYAEIIRKHNDLPPVSRNDPGSFDFKHPDIQLAFWIDAMLHNCRGSLCTLSHIVNYVYSLNIPQKDVEFVRSLKESQSQAQGIHNILKQLYFDDWFSIVSRLSNRSYQKSLNLLTPKISLGNIPLRYNIHFPVNTSRGNLTNQHNYSIQKGTEYSDASMELDEFTLFITRRLKEYLIQIENIISNDCIDISEGKHPRSDSDIPNLQIPVMEFLSWRIWVSTDDLEKK
jgi:hypothetical protein